MKVKIILLCTIVIFTMPIFAQNWFIGGSFWYGTSLENRKSITEWEDIWNNNSGINNLITESKTFSFIPSIGYRFDQFDLGISPIVHFRTSESESFRNDFWEDRYFYTHLFFKQEQIEYGIGIFARYSFLSWKKFSLIGQSRISYTFFTEDINRKDRRYTYIWESDLKYESHIEETGKGKGQRLSLNLSPVFEYSVSRRFSIHTNFGISDIMTSYTKSTTDTTSIDYVNDRITETTRKTNHFSSRLPSSFWVSITSFNLGFYYHF